MNLKSHMEKNVDFQNKNTFVEKNIEKRIKFLNPTRK